MFGASTCQQATNYHGCAIPKSSDTLTSSTLRAPGVAHADHRKNHSLKFTEKVGAGSRREARGKAFFSTLWLTSYIRCIILGFLVHAYSLQTPLRRNFQSKTGRVIDLRQGMILYVRQERGQSDQRRLTFYRYSVEHSGSVWSRHTVRVARSGAWPTPQNKSVTTSSVDYEGERGKQHQRRVPVHSMLDRRTSSQPDVRDR